MALHALQNPSVICLIPTLVSGSRALAFRRCRVHFLRRQRQSKTHLGDHEYALPSAATRYAQPLASVAVSLSSCTHIAGMRPVRAVLNKGKAMCLI